MRKNILNNILLIVDDISFENILLDSINIHNNNIHTSAGFSLSFLLKKEDEGIYDSALDYIKKIYKITEKTNEDFYFLNKDEHLISNNGSYKNWKIIKWRRTKNKTNKIPLTVPNNYYCGIITVKMHAYLYTFKKDEVLLIEPKNCKLINEKWMGTVN